MACEALDDAAHLEVPDNDLGVLARTGHKPVALADVNVCNKVEVAVQTGLQTERVAVPDFDDPAKAKQR